MIAIRTLSALPVNSYRVVKPYTNLHPLAMVLFCTSLILGLAMPADLKEFLQMLLPAIMGAVGAYMGIRVDLAKLAERVTTALDRSESAHSRIDKMLDK